MRHWIRNAVWNDAQNRLRTPIRLLAVGVVFSLITAVFGVGLFSVLGLTGVDPGAFDEFTLLVIGSVVSVPATVATLWLGARYVDRRPFVDYGLHIDRTWWLDLGFGLVLGAGLQIGIASVGLLAGWYSVGGLFLAQGPVGLGGALLLVAVLFVSVGIVEELLARGWLLTNLAEGLLAAGRRAAVGIAVLLSSVLFGVAHLANPGASWVSATIISFAGVFLAVGYVLTGELGIPIGVHITWNFFQGPVFGLGVSGLEMPVAIVALEPIGPEWITGGGFGPEAGLLGFLAVLVGITATLLWVYHRTGSVKIHAAVTAGDGQRRSPTDRSAETPIDR